MSKKRRKSSPAAGRKGDAALQDPAKEKRLKPLARNLLFFSVVLMAAAEMLFRGGVIKEVLANGLGIVALLASLGAVAVQFGTGSSKNALK